MNYIFKEYDIRGIAGVDFDNNFVYELAKATATYFKEHLAEDDAHTCVIGRDCRVTSPDYENELVRGFTESGVNCILIGMVPTPCLYFAVKHLKLKAGIMITASHNPKEYNGFKIVCGESTLYGDALQQIRRYTEQRKFHTPTDGKKAHTKNTNIVPAYVDDIKFRLPKLDKFKVVVDAGNGAGGIVCPEVLRALGTEVIELYCQPDGAFPNHHPDPTVESNMQDLKKAIVQHKADFGIGLDGDGDRIGIMTKEGKLLKGDELLAIFGRELINREPNANIIADVKCSERLFSDRHLNGRVIMNQTGHCLIKKAMAEHNALLAGELSGHMFFKDNWYGFDDASYSAARVIYTLTELKKHHHHITLENMPNWEELYSTPEIKFPMADENKSKAISFIQEHYSNSTIYELNTMDGARLVRKSGPMLWALIRQSNTSPYLTLRAEGKNKQEVEALIKELQDLATKAIG